MDDRGTPLPDGWMGEELFILVVGKFLSWSWQETLAVIVLGDFDGFSAGRLVSVNS